MCSGLPADVHGSASLGLRGPAEGRPLRGLEPWIHGLAGSRLAPPVGVVVGIASESTRDETLTWKRLEKSGLSRTPACHSMNSSFSSEYQPVGFHLTLAHSQSAEARRVAAATLDWSSFAASACSGACKDFMTHPFTDSDSDACPLATQLLLPLRIAVLLVPAWRLRERRGHIFAIYLVHLLPRLHCHSANHEPWHIRARLRGCLAPPSGFSLLPKFGIALLHGHGHRLHLRHATLQLHLLHGGLQLHSLHPRNERRRGRPQSKRAQGVNPSLHLHRGRARHAHAKLHPLRGLTLGRESFTTLEAASQQLDPT